MSKYVQRFKENECLWYRLDSTHITRVQVIEQNKQLTKTKVIFLELNIPNDWLQTFNLSR